MLLSGKSGLAARRPAVPGAAAGTPAVPPGPSPWPPWSPRLFPESCPFPFRVSPFGCVPVCPPGLPRSGLPRRPLRPPARAFPPRASSRLGRLGFGEMLGARPGHIPGAHRGVGRQLHGRHGIILLSPQCRIKGGKRTTPAWPFQPRDPSGRDLGNYPPFPSATPQRTQGAYRVTREPGLVCWTTPAGPGHSGAVRSRPELRAAGGPAPAGTLWRNRNFLLLWSGQTVSEMGSAVTQLALPLTAVVVLRASTFQVGLLTSAATAAFALIALPAGALVDRRANGGS